MFERTGKDNLVSAVESFISRIGLRKFFFLVFVRNHMFAAGWKNHQMTKREREKTKQRRVQNGVEKKWRARRESGLFFGLLSIVAESYGCQSNYS